MKWYMTSILLLALIFSGTSEVHAKMPIMIRANVTEDNAVGRSVVFSLKDLIRGSNTYELITTQPDSLVACIVIDMMADTELATLYGVSLVMSGPKVDFYLNSFVGKCGFNRSADAAKVILTNADGNFFPEK